jgi:muramoyltetrapeptide carboxypeptidase LdcA involved in peptidoglycan recycling
MDRARDITTAFEDPDVGAVMASIGGDDQISVLKFLNGEVIRAHPKRFFGYSDNTNLLTYLHHLGIVGYHGGSVLVHLARPGGTHPATMDSLRHALFTSGWYEIAPQPTFSDVHGDWSDPSTLNDAMPTEDEPGWAWVNATGVVEGPGWGGNLEVLQWVLAVGRDVGPPSEVAGAVLLLETSEETPTADDVTRMMRTLGERGILDACAGVVLGKAKAWRRDRPLDLSDRRIYREQQREAVLTQLDYYHPGLPTVIGPDIGHTDPQVIMPIGGPIRLDGPNRRLTVHY